MKYKRESVLTEYCGIADWSVLFLSVERNRYRQLSICNRFSIFSPQFTDIPRKISVYLRPYPTSNANTRNIRGFHKPLNSNDLCLIGIFQCCKKHHFGMRNGPFQGAIWCFSAPEMGFIAWWMGQYQNAGRAFSDYDIGYIKRRYGQE